MNFAETANAWDRFGDKLELHLDELANEAIDRKAARSRWDLRKPQAGQLLHIAFGVVLLWFVARLWSEMPKDVLLLVSGALLHLYAIAVIMMAGIALWRINAIDLREPLIEAQSKLSEAEKAIVKSKLVAGVPWWFLWLAALVLILARLGVSMQALANGRLLVVLGGSIAGMAISLLLRRQLISSGLLKDPVGQQLIGVQRRLAEIADARNA